MKLTMPMNINEAEAQKALERAQKMKAEAKDQVSLEHAQQLGRPPSSPSAGRWPQASTKTARI